MILDGMDRKTFKFRMHLKRDVSDLIKKAKEWIKKVLPASFEYENMFLVCRGNMLEDGLSLA